MDISKINGNGLQTFKGVSAGSLGTPPDQGAERVRPTATIDPAVLTRLARESEGMSEVNLKSTTDALNDIASAMNRSLDFTVHDGTDTLVVKVVDRQTNEVIKEIPGEAFLDFVGRMHDFLGLLFDEQA